MTEFRRTVDTELANIRLTPAILYSITEEKKMKKKLTFGLAVAIAVLVIMTGVALAVTGAFDALMSLWADSFSRMNTTGAVDVVDEADVPAYLREFEEDYGGVKEDLILSTVPGEEDLSLSEALQIAKQAIFDKFGTPPEELDAMGVYPEFFKTPYMDMPSEWWFYFSPRTGEDINEDHDFPAPGEYRVYLNSPSGKVTYCGWYNDDFWPEYAQRSWNAGKKEYVYEQAKRNDFRKQSVEDRAAFVAIFEAEGFDVSVFDISEDKLLSSMELELSFMDPKENLLNSNDAVVDLALREMESRFGLTGSDLENCCFIVCRSLYPSETTDLCFCYNYEVEAEAKLKPCESSAASYAKRLGLYMIRIDPGEMKAVDAVRSDHSPDISKADDPTLLLGRRNWTAKDLPDYYEMREELRKLDEQYGACLLTASERDNERDRIMLRYGGDERIYTADRQETNEDLTIEQWLYLHNLTEEQIVQAGRAYLTGNALCPEEDLNEAVYSIGTRYDHEEQPDTDQMHPTLLVTLDRDRSRTQWYFQFDMDLAVTDFQVMEGLPGSNG